MINKVLHFKFECIVLSYSVQKSTEHICFDLLLNLPPNMLIRLGNLSWFITEALGGNGLILELLEMHMIFNIYRLH